MEMISEYSYLNNIAEYLITKDPEIIFDEYNLSGARLSGKTTSITIAIAKIIGVSLSYQKKVAIYACRKMTKSVPDLAKEISIALDDLGIEYQMIAKSKMTSFYRFQFANDSFIEVVGITRNKSTVNLKGVAKCHGYDLCIDWFEEANECDIKDFQDLRFSIRGAKKRISITSCNPDLEFQPHIKFLNENVPFDINKLKAYGSQMGIWTTKFGKKERQNIMIKKILNHYTTFKVNPYLSDDEIQLLETLKNTDPEKAISWYYGAPGSLGGTVFGNYLSRVRRTIDYTPRLFYVGLDLGYSESLSAHPTTAILLGSDIENYKLDALEEYFHDNTDNKHLTINQIDKQIVINIDAWMKKYNIPFIDVKVDYGSGGLVRIDNLNNVKNEINPNIRFIAVDKDVWLVKDRVEAVQMLMVSNQLGINRDRTPNLFKQLSMMVYKDTTQTSHKVEILDINDDTFDALCYAIMPILKRVVENMPLIKE